MTSEQKLPAIGSVWGDPDDTATWVRVNSVDEIIKVSSFAGIVWCYKSENFPPVGYVRLDDEWSEIAFQPACPLINGIVDTALRERFDKQVRCDSEGRDVTNLPAKGSI